MRRELSDPHDGGSRLRRRSLAPLARFSGLALSLLCSACSVPIDTGLGAPRRSAPVVPADDPADAARRAYETGNPDEGERMARRAEQQSDEEPAEKPRLASTLTDIALQQSRQGNHQEAVELHERALRLREEAYGESHIEVAESLNFLGAAYYQVQRYDDAEKAFTRAVAVRKLILGPDDRLTGLSMNNLAFFYAGVGKYDQADPLFVESIRIIEKAPDASWAEKARAMDNYAAMLLDAGRTEEAAAVEKRSAAYRTKRRQIEDIMDMTR